MWKKLKIDEVDYLINHYTKDYRHKIILTDFIHLWFEEIEENKLLVRCKEMNKLIEASDDILLGHVLSLVEGNEGNIVRTFSPSNSDDSKVLKFVTNLEGFKFKIMFLLTVANPMQFFKEVTLNFLTTMTELEKRYYLLVDVIKSKDLEIMEYKLEGGRISRKAVETDRFDIQAFSEKCGEGISSTKSQITGHPSDTLTPLLKDLLDKISTAPVYEYANKPLEEASSQHEKKRTVVKIKSPTKKKKRKMYEDDDDDDDDEIEKEGEEGKSVVNEIIKIEKDNETSQKQHKGRSKGKFKLNL